jgi:hypothetical protein
MAIIAQVAVVITANGLLGEAVFATVAEMPNAQFFALSGLGHAEALFRSELVLPRVVDFLRSVAARE